MAVAAVAARSHLRGAEAGGVGQLELPGLANVIPNAPTWITRLSLAVGDGAYKNVPLWSGAQRWARIEVPIAYDLRYKSIRHLMVGNGVSRDNVIKVADARARFAEGKTGRHCRPTNATLAKCAGVDKRIVQRASLALRLMGCATEILRGRQRTKAERLASWAMNDRSRGWASVWALHTPIPAVDNSRDRKGLWRPISGQMSPHPRRGSVSLGKVPFQGNLPTENDPQDRAGHVPPINGGATRHSTDTSNAKRSKFRPVDDKGRLLAARWLADGQTPAWAQRFTPRGWGRLLAPAAAMGWTPADINMMIREWRNVGGHYLPPQPYRPHGLLGTMFKWHGDLCNRPAAAADAQAAEQLAAEQAHTAAYIAELHAPTPARPEHRAAMRTGWKKLGPR
ncbi:plasmid replication protein [Mycobacteroides abscessus subsp. massiliense]|nr:plasmid replication protein [Mycobacteroides abscessus subsp. massiliense]SKH91882.1 plasmid replication protein [Mycobacteroides abscessus subsp. massiliense]SKI12490.1 plasmid replication protein [Mycobacteroides abscessus subsp. massiliense]SKK22326.1 plasmid replication protein [Mycobacteroides abscessus subsp. massiliense]SKK30883.1 plasmid replication protein [Mycobacteroides abscessus subsp. massiliense]